MSVNNPVLNKGPPESVGMDPVRIAALKRLGASWVEKGDTPSLVLLVARRGTIVLHEAFGVRRPEDIEPTLKPDSIFPIASCSKSMTAAIVMCLVEDGLIGLNRPFVDYVPELDVPSVQWLDEATVGDLLCHTSCIDDLQWTEFLNEAAKKSPNLPPAAPGQHPALNRRIRLVVGAPLARQPGSAMLYSNFGYNLLGDIVRRVSGKPFWQFARARLFEPLSMNDTHYRFPREELGDRRVYRKPGMPGTQPVPGLHGGCDSPEFDELDQGATSVSSTARDLAIFQQMLLNRGQYDGRRILSAASVAAMTRSQVGKDLPALVAMIDPITGKKVEFEIKGSDYGYGQYVFGVGDRFAMNGSLFSPRAIGHMGYTGAYMWADPEYELIGIFLCVVPTTRRGFTQRNSDLFMNATYAAIVD